MTPLRPPVRPLAVPGAEHVVRWQPGEWLFREGRSPVWAADCPACSMR